MDKESKNLLRKILLRFILFIILFPLFIFLPAGSFTYWQGWVFFSIFVMSSAVMTLYLWKKDPELLKRRMKAGAGAEKEKAQKIIQFFSGITYFLAIILSILDHRFGWSNVPLFFVAAGDVLIVLGYFLVFLVLKENTFAAATIEIAEGQKVITTGPYAVVRHPMYAGALIMMIGVPIALGSWWGLLMLVPLTLLAILRLLDEEKLLSKNLDGYTAYCQKVRYRLIPFIW